jgi:hypothetical protein
MQLHAATLGMFLVAAGPAISQVLPTDFQDGVIEVGLQAVGFSTSDIIEVEEFELDGLFGIQVTLSPRLDEEIGALTRDKLGYEICVTLCGQRVVEARIQQEITTAQFVVTTGDLLETQRMAEFFRKPPCAPRS